MAKTSYYFRYKSDCPCDEGIDTGIEAIFVAWQKIHRPHKKEGK